jgi:hypothetical protein
MKRNNIFLKLKILYIPKNKKYEKTKCINDFDDNFTKF